MKPKEIVTDALKLWPERVAVADARTILLGKPKRASKDSAGNIKKPPRITVATLDFVTKALGGEKERATHDVYFVVVPREVTKEVRSPILTQAKIARGVA